jgi:hypothetical protein
MTATTIDPGRASARAPARKFYFWIGLAFIATAFLGFAPTFWAPLAQGRFHANPIVYVHGAVFFSWTLFYAYQASLVSGGKTMRHRDIGVAGVSIATAMTMLGLLVAIQGVTRFAATAYLEDAKRFAVVPIVSIVTFAVLFALAIVNVKKPETHKRLMVLTIPAVIDAAIARWFLVLLAPPLPPGAIAPPPPTVVALPPALIGDLFILAGAIHDWRTRGKVHPVYLIGGPIVIAMHVLRGSLGATGMWNAFITWLITLMG